MHPTLKKSSLQGGLKNPKGAGLVAIFRSGEGGGYYMLFARKGEGMSFNLPKRKVCKVHH